MLVGTWDIMCARIGYFSAYKSISQLIVWRGGSFWGSAGIVGVVWGMDLVGAGLSVGRVFCCGLWEFVVDGWAIFGCGLSVGRTYCGCG